MSLLKTLAQIIAAGLIGCAVFLVSCGILLFIRALKKTSKSGAMDGGRHERLRAGFLLQAGLMALLLAAPVAIVYPRWIRAGNGEAIAVEIITCLLVFILGFVFALTVRRKERAAATDPGSREPRP